MLTKNKKHHLVTRWNEQTGKAAVVDCNPCQVIPRSGHIVLIVLL